MKKSILKNTLFIIYTSLFCSQNILSQTPINVIESKNFNQIIINDTTFQKFAGNVIIEYSDFKIICDTILIDEYKNLIRGWGNTQIFNDTLNCKSDSINIRQNINEIIFYKNSCLKTEKMTIFSNKINYNYDKETVKYHNTGTVITQDYTINSQKFKHDLKNQISNFNKNIELTGSEYDILGEDIEIHNNTIQFSGSTLIKDVDFTISCNKGYLEKGNYLKLSKGVTVDFEDKVVESRELNRNIKKNKNNFTNNVHITIDSTKHIFGQQLLQLNNISTITEDCQIKLINNIDSTIIIGDEIIIDDNNQSLQVNNNVIISGNELDGKCENIDFLSNYTEINMRNNPVLWLNEVQLTGETIILYTIQNNLDSLYIDKNPFIVSPNDSIEYYNQIKGKVLNGKFKNNKMDYINIYGNGQMKYFQTQKEDDQKISINNTEASGIKLTFNNNNIKKVFCFQEIESSNLEIKKQNMRDQEKKLLYLEGFRLENKEY